jgi:hypothetical protein
MSASNQTLEEFRKICKDIHNISKAMCNSHDEIYNGIRKIFGGYHAVNMILKTESLENILRTICSYSEYGYGCQTDVELDHLSEILRDGIGSFDREISKIYNSVLGRSIDDNMIPILDIIRKLPNYIMLMLKRQELEQVLDGHYGHTRSPYGRQIDRLSLAVSRINYTKNIWIDSAHRAEISASIAFMIREVNKICSIGRQQIAIADFDNLQKLIDTFGKIIDKYCEKPVTTNQIIMKIEYDAFKEIENTKTIVELLKAESKPKDDSNGWEAISDTPKNDSSEEKTPNNDSNEELKEDYVRVEQGEQSAAPTPRSESVKNGEQSAAPTPSPEPIVETAKASAPSEPPTPRPEPITETAKASAPSEPPTPRPEPIVETAKASAPIPVFPANTDFKKILENCKDFESFLIVLNNMKNSTGLRFTNDQINTIKTMAHKYGNAYLNESDINMFSKVEQLWSRDIPANARRINASEISALCVSYTGFIRLLSYMKENCGVYYSESDVTKIYAAASEYKCMWAVDRWAKIMKLTMSPVANKQ